MKDKQIFPDNPKAGDRVRVEGRLYEYNAYQECWNRVEEFPKDFWKNPDLFSTQYENEVKGAKE